MNYLRCNSVKFLLVMFLVNIFSISFATSSEDEVTKINWGGIDVIWIKDEKFPLFNLNIYFGDGALSDHSSRSGETAVMFDNLMSGTNRYSQEQISDTLDYFGVDIGSSVTHEYSLFSASGLIKNMVPTIKMVCHLFKDSTFPKKIIKSELKKTRDALDSMVSDHGDLASRAFRNISLRGSPYENPANGTLRGLKNIGSKTLERKLTYFNTKVKKRIYLSGPKEVLKLEHIIKTECGWSSDKSGATSTFLRNSNYKYKGLSKSKIYLITVPKANQAQVRVGRFLSKDEIRNPELMNLSASFLGGGFTSKLMREVRVKRGLTYSIGSFAAAQRDYGRAVISTFTKNETAKKIIDVVKETLSNVLAGKFKDDELETARGHLVGSYLFKFESSKAYLSQLIALDHMNMKHERLYKFPDIVKGFSKEDVTKALKELYSWNKMYVVVLGSKDLKKQLEKLGKVTVLSYKKFL